MSIEMIDTVILGAGVAGLGAALKARELGRQAVIFEARRATGGLLDNFTIDGFRFDHAVHLSFATEEKVRHIFDQTPYHTHPAESFCFDQDRWLKHPIQNNLSPLPAADKVQLIKSFLSRPEHQEEDNYESWLRHQYGDGIAQRYPIRYTQKYWATPAKELSTSWIGNRMRRAELDEILYGAFSAETPNTYYTKEMRYPKIGGYKAFIQPLIDAAEIRLEHRAVRVDLHQKTITFANGTQVRYRQLVSSLPLPVMANILLNTPQDVLDAAGRLKATSIDLISVAFNKSLIKDLWFYIYDEDILASRAYSPSAKAAENAPDGCSSLQFEIYNRGTSSRFDTQQLKDNTLHALKKMGIADEQDIIFMDHRFLEYGNVIFDKNMEKDRKTVLAWLEQGSIASCGRFGEWDYLWSNQSLLSGYEALK
ncbi:MULTISPECIES: NAD(P)/FAD-dependent oxidoreductase [unclassified Janthinobacterium]|uniref:protoporphyrinogen/coproporphyrinogen oxidase n=1 Tax=unclassified Janthinobacterium TaxID=2610881 RepID=UPI001799F2E3|nr:MULTISPECIES: FAD-dependent oxidoreductase [unclassified Janthinobacterium]MBB5608599.1 protoporphyrinogen oxidase [Janthinobacterium sp. S3T4]MBB5614120.1 protoporphyrinogen oxidase [Janthinobacterium sp. S3M3]